MNREHEVFLSLLKKIEKTGGPSAVKRFLASNGKDVPTLKLTDAEMIALKGGQANGSSRWSPVRLAYESGGMDGLAAQFDGPVINPPYP